MGNRTSLSVRALREVRSLSPEARLVLFESLEDENLINDEICEQDVIPLSSELKSVDEESIEQIEQWLRYYEASLDVARKTLYTDIVDFSSARSKVHSTRAKIRSTEQIIDVLNETRNRLIAKAEQQKGRVSDDTGRSESTSGNREAD